MLVLELVGEKMAPSFLWARVRKGEKKGEIIELLDKELCSCIMHFI